MVQPLEHDVDSEGTTRRSNGTEERVPTEFFNVRFWIVLYIVAAVVYVGSHAQPFLEPEKVPLELWVVSGIFAVEIVLWIIALQLWAKAKLAGFWLVAVFAHMGFLGRSFMLITGIMAGDARAIGINAIWVIAIFFCLLINIWSSALRSFFKRLNGVCPACRKAPLGELRKNKTWTCMACGEQLLWLVPDSHAEPSLRSGRPRKLKVSCPKCGRRLKGATSAMIGDIGVCQRCRAEFEITD